MNANERSNMQDMTAGSAGKGMSESGLLIGELRVELFDADKRLKDFREVNNLITTLGRNASLELMLASPAANQKPTHMGVGTGAVAATLADTTLTSEARVALTSKSRSTNVLTMVGDWAAGVATQANTEAGIWDLSASGQLLCRAVFAAINKGASDTLKITWTWTQT